MFLEYWEINETTFMWNHETIYEISITFIIVIVIEL